MSEDVPSSGLTDRVRQILAVFEKPGASVAQLLCDNHDPASIAYRVVASDLSACELTYDELATSSRRLANSLAATGLGQGDRIVTLLDRKMVVYGQSVSVRVDVGVGRIIQTKIKRTST